MALRANTFAETGIHSIAMAKTIRLATSDDAAEMAAIYSHFVLNTPTSFESEPPNEEEMRRRITATTERYPWLVCDVDGGVAGYAYASQHRVRYHYQWSVDVGVYVHENFRRQGIATDIYRALLAVIPLQGYVSAYAGITLPNPASVALHESMGFIPVGIYRNVGFKLGSWHDVGWWQLTLIDPPAEPKNLLTLAEVLTCPDWEAALAYPAP